MKVLFVNQFDLFINNSAGITVRDMFGDDFCKKMPKLCIKNNMATYKKDDEELSFSFGLEKWMRIVNHVKNEKPDIVYSTASSSKVLLFLIYIKLKLKIPVLMHYYDNWREIGSYRAKNALLYLLNGPHERALVISDEMNAYYRKKYHGNYTTLMVGTANKTYGHIRKTTDGNIELLYAGGLHLGRANALCEIEKAINKHCSGVQLIIATFKNGDGYDKYHNLFDETRTKFLVDIPHEEMEDYYTTVDALLFVESAPDDQLNYLRYSMSTKIPEYLSSGLPIICYAKPGIACYEYFKRTETALLASSYEELIDAIKQVQRNEVEDMVENARVSAKRDFDHDAQQAVLKQVIEEMIVANANSKRKKH